MKKCFRGSNLIIVFVLAVGVASLTGCEPLRKKFTRKKKGAVSSQDIPVLEPVDYPDKVEKPGELLKQGYGMWKLWYGQLTADMQENSTAKRLIYDVNQLIAQLEEIERLFPAPQQTLLGGYIDRLLNIRAEFEKPAAMRNAYLKGDIDRLDKEFRANFRPEVAGKFLVQIVND